MMKILQLIIFIVSTIFITAKSQNCSIYNPCGKNGYCVDNNNGQWECQCKFWWNGTFCDQQTSSGIQVITLGVLLAIVIIIFYGLEIGCAVRRKKQEPKIEKKKINQIYQVNPKLTDIALINVKQSARCSSIIIALLVLIITTIALIIKWLLLQPIHNELVDKYKQQEPIYYNRNSFCDIIDVENFNLLTFPIACFLILIFIIFSRRSSYMREKCRGYIAPIVPLDFYIHVKRKFAAVVFAIVADELLDIIIEVITGNTSSDQGVIVVYLLRVTKVFVIGCRYYPELAAVYIDSLLTLTCASFYAWLDFITSIIYQSLCNSDYYPSNDNFNETNGMDIIQLFDYYGTGQNLIVIQLMTDIPRIVCWSYIVIKLPSLLIQKIYSKIKHRNNRINNNLNLTREEKILLHSSSFHSVEMLYVKNLFRPIDQRYRKSRLFFARLIPKLIYYWRDDFRFSSRIICIYSSIILILFFITKESCILIIPILNTFQTSIQNLLDRILSSTNQSSFPIPNLVRPYIFAIMTALIITIIQLLILLANIRRNLFQIFCGDDSEIPKRNKSNYLSYSTGNFHFAGYFIGYLIWGYVLIVIFTFIIYICIDAFITFGSVRFLENIFKIIIPILLLTYFKQYINNILAQYVFLQHYGDILAINNRRILMIFLYFNFFLDTFLGFISSIIRILKSIIGGLLYMCRLDYSPLGRKLETIDAGFSAYCGFIHLEAVHRNPIMLAVASYLYNRMKAKQYYRNNSLISMNKINLNQLKTINRWHIAITLIQNPSLKYLRKHALLEIENKNLNIIENIIKQRQSQHCQKFLHRSSLISENDLEKIWQQRILHIHK